MCLPGIGFARFARAGPDNKFRFGSFYYNKDSLYGLRRQSDVFRGGVGPDRPKKTHIVMSTVKFKGSPVNLAGEFIREGVAAPDFELVKTDLTPLRLSDLKGRRVVLNIFPSLDTGVCAASVRRFNKLAASLPDTVVVPCRRTCRSPKPVSARPRESRTSFRRRTSAPRDSTRPTVSRWPTVR